MRFQHFIESTQNNMYYLALKYMKNPDDAKDVLQDAYIKAWQSLPTLKDPEHFPAWLEEPWQIPPKICL